VKIAQEKFRVFIFFFVFFLAFGFFCGCLPVRRTRNRLCATNSHLAREVSFSPTVVSTAQGGFFSNFATNGGEKADEGNERQPHAGKNRKKKRENNFSPTANALKRDK